MSAGHMVDTRRKSAKKSYNPMDHISYSPTDEFETPVITEKQKQGARALIAKMAGGDADLFMQMLGLTEAVPE